MRYQVLRLVQITNTKQTDPDLRKVRVLHVEEVNGETLRHDFDRFADTVLPFTRKQYQLTRDEREARKAGRVQLKLIQGGKRDGAIVLGYQQLHWDRLADFRALVKLRGYIDEGLIYRKNKT